MPLKAHSSVGEHHLDTVGVCGSIPHVPTKTAGCDERRPFVLSVDAKRAAPRDRGLRPQGRAGGRAGRATAPRCGRDLRSAGPAGERASRASAANRCVSGGGPRVPRCERLHPATFLCDLPSRILALAARGKGGTASSLPRGANGVVGAAKTVSILPSSK